MNISSQALLKIFHLFDDENELRIKVPSFDMIFFLSVTLPVRFELKIWRDRIICQKPNEAFQCHIVTF